MAQTQSLSLIVAEPVVVGDADTDEGGTEVETREEFETRGKRLQAALAVIRPQRRDVDLADVKADLDRVQSQIDSLLANMPSHDSKGFRLAQAEVSLAISASGSIGVASAGVQAGITLVFARLEGST